MIEPGRMLLHYRVLRKIGEGGMGEVYLAEDTRLGREVALKLLSEQWAGDPERLARFAREARAVAALNHPNIVTIFSVEEAEGLHFLTMERIQGATLGDRIPPGGMAITEFLSAAIPLADALAAAHARGIVHRDLKPTNIMVNERGDLKVLDFGLAKLREAGPLRPRGEETWSSTASIVTGPNPVLGTVGYMSPEQAEGRPVDCRSDVFSLGIILYEMATGIRPFRGSSGVSILASIIKDTPAPIALLRPEYPASLSGIVQRCLAKSAEERFDSARELGTALQTFRRQASGGPPLSSDPPRPGWRRGLWPAAIGALLLFGAILGTGVMMNRRREALAGTREVPAVLSGGASPSPAAATVESGPAEEPAGTPGDRIPSAPEPVAPPPMPTSPTAGPGHSGNEKTTGTSVTPAPPASAAQPPAGKAERPTAAPTEAVASTPAPEPVLPPPDPSEAVLPSAAPAEPTAVPPPAAPADPRPPLADGLSVVVSADHRLNKACDPGSRESARLRHAGRYCTDAYRMCLQSRASDELTEDDLVIIDLVHRMNSLPCPPDYEEVSRTRHQGKYCTDAVRLCVQRVPVRELRGRPVIEDALFTFGAGCPYRYTERSIDRHQGEYGRDVMRACVLFTAESTPPKPKAADAH